MDAIRGAKLHLGVDPLGGAGVHYWAPIAERYGLNLTVVSETVDPTFRFMTVDWDGQIRMDPSSVYAMQRLIGMKDRFDLSFACDTDHDRHGIVTKSEGLLPPNHYLCACDPLPFPTSAKMEQEGGRRQNSGEQPDDRPRHGEAWPNTLRSACGLQVVRGRFAGRFTRLRRRRERRRVVLRVWTEAFGRRTKTESFPRYSPRKSPREWIATPANSTANSRANSASLSTIASRRQRLLIKRNSWQNFHQSRSRSPSWLARKFRPSSPGSGQQCAHRRSEGNFQKRVVRSAPLGHRKYLQDLRGKLPRRGSFAPNS